MSTKTIVLALLALLAIVWVVKRKAGQPSKESEEKVKLAAAQDEPSVAAAEVDEVFEADSGGNAAEQAVSAVESEHAELHAKQEPLSAPAEVSLPTKETGEILETHSNNSSAVEAALVVNADVVPEDATLRRHYVAGREAERETIVHPYPTDSVLRRHYDSLQAAELKAGLASETHVEQLEKMSEIPEDATLRRHYLASREAEREAIVHPYPTDSVLRRHYDSLHAEALTTGFSDEAYVVPVAKVVEAFEDLGPEAVERKKTLLPEDSVLRRHFLAQIRAQVEAQLQPRPTDSVLMRHYDAVVKAKMEAYLDG